MADLESATNTPSANNYFYGWIDYVYWKNSANYSDISSVTTTSAIASDASGGGAGIQVGDKATIIFNGATQGTAINSSNINTALALNNSHSWLDGLGGITSVVWSTATYTNDTLTITLSDNGSTPTVATGDTITLDGIIKDSLGGAISGSISVTGSF